MNTTSPLIRSAVTGALTGRRLPATLTMPAGIQSRTGLPVVSNRAFVAAWGVRRASLVAAARLTKAN